MCQSKFGRLFIPFNLFGKLHQSLTKEREWNLGAEFILGVAFMGYPGELPPNLGPGALGKTTPRIKSYSPILENFGVLNNSKRCN